MESRQEHICSFLPGFVREDEMKDHEIYVIQSMYNHIEFMGI